MIFINEFLQLLNIVFNQFLANFLTESITLTILSIVLVIILITRSELCNYFEAKTLDSTSSTFFSLLIEVSFPLLYFAFLNYISNYFQNARVSFLLFNSFIFLYFGFIIVKYARNIPNIYNNSTWIIALNILIVTAAISHLFTNLSINFYDIAILLHGFIFVLENSVKYVFYIIIFRGIKYIADINSTKYGFTGRFFKNLFPFIYFAYLAVIVTVLWVLIILKLNYSIFIGVLSIVVLVAVFAIKKSYITQLFEWKPDTYIGANQGLKRSLHTVAILFFAWAVYNISLSYFKLEYVVNFLSNRHLIITDYVKISYFSLISDGFLFLIFLSLLGLLKNLILFYETNKPLRI